MKYVDQFLNLKCSSDVLNTVGFMNNARKEITESMAVIRLLKKIALSAPMYYTLYDFCAGNALTSTIAAHLLPFKEVIAVDKNYRDRDWGKINRFSYIEEDIVNVRIDRPSVIIGIHACGVSSSEIIKKFNNESYARHLILMPCCVGKLYKEIPAFFKEKLGRYNLWCWQLMGECVGRVRIKEDKNVLSPCNNIITSKKEM